MGSAVAWILHTDKALQRFSELLLDTNGRQAATECTVKTFLNIKNTINFWTVKIVDLELQLLKALYELSSVQLTVDLLNKEYNYKQDNI